MKLIHTVFRKRTSYIFSSYIFINCTPVKVKRLIREPNKATTGVIALVDDVMSSLHQQQQQQQLELSVLTNAYLEVQLAADMLVPLNLSRIVQGRK